MKWIWNGLKETLKQWEFRRDIQQNIFLCQINFKCFHHNLSNLLYLSNYTSERIWCWCERKIICWKSLFSSLFCSFLMIMFFERINWFDSNFERCWACWKGWKKIMKKIERYNKNLLIKTKTTSCSCWWISSKISIYNWIERREH